MSGQHDKTSVAAISILASGGMAAAKFVVGVAIGPAVALSLGLVAALVCVAVMAQRHNGHPHPETDRVQSHEG